MGFARTLLGNKERQTRMLTIIQLADLQTVSSFLLRLVVEDKDAVFSPSRADAWLFFVVVVDIRIGYWFRISGSSSGNDN